MFKLENFDIEELGKYSSFRKQEVVYKALTMDSAQSLDTSLIFHIHM